MNDSIQRAGNSAEEKRAAGSVSRRAIVKGAAWAVPVIALAAPVPVYAASACVPTTALDSLTPGQPASPLVFQPSGLTATLSFTANTPDGGDGDTGEVAATSTMPPWNYVEIEMTQQLTNGNYVEVTITLSAPVDGLSFVIHDIDWVDDQWNDTVVVFTPGFEHVNGGNIQGIGSAGDPFRPIAEGDNPISSGLGDVRLTWPGTVQVVTFHYVAGMTGDSQNQHIGLGDLSYQACLPPGTPGAARALAAPQQRRLSSGAPAFAGWDGATDQ